MASEPSMLKGHRRWTALIRRIACLGSCLLVLFSLTACGSPDASTSPPQVDSTDTRSQELMELVEENDSLSALSSALQAADLAKMLRDAGPHTLLAPTNAAFDAFPSFDSLLARPYEDSLRTLLSRHIIRGRIHAAGVDDSLRVSTLQATPLTFQRPPATRQLLVNGHRVLGSHEAKNGTLHVISAVLFPPPPDTTRE